MDENGRFVLLFFFCLGMHFLGGEWFLTVCWWFLFFCFVLIVFFQQFFSVLLEPLAGLFVFFTAPKAQMV